MASSSMEKIDAMEESSAEDLKAFERRLTEVVAAYRPSTFRWRIVLVAVSIFTTISAWYWIRDPRTRFGRLTESLFIHPIFTVTTLTLILLFILGIHKRRIAAQIITSRTRSVLRDFNMCCDDNGKLIMKPLNSYNHII